MSGRRCGPEGDQVADRGVEAQFGHAGGAQAAQEVADLALHVGDGGLDGADVLGHGVVAAELAELGDHLGVHVDREQVRADVVVQVAGDVGALLLLDGQELVAQQAVAVGAWRPARAAMRLKPRCRPMSSLGPASATRPE